MTPTQTGAAAAKRVDFWTVLLCWTTVMLEGYDLVVLPAVGPDHFGWDRGEFTHVLTMSYVGVAIGATAVGPLADRLGRRMLLIGSVVVFSVFTMLVPLTSDPTPFGILRLLAGLGLGACMPLSLTMMAESLPDSMRARASTLTMTGYHTGAVIASLLAIPWGTHWEYLFFVMGGLGLAIAALQMVKLRESEVFLAASQGEKTPLSALLKGNYLRAVLCLWAASFMGLALVYGLNSWLPSLFGAAGYDAFGKVFQLFVLNLGGIAGLILGGFVADRFGLNKILNLWFAAGAVMLFVLSIKLGSSALLTIAVFLTGVFIFSAQVLVYAYATKFFPPNVRSTALGSASGVGRIATILSPMLVVALWPDEGTGYPGGFYLFAGIALCGLVAVSLLPKADKANDAA